MNIQEKVHLSIPAVFGYEDMPAAVAQVWAVKLGTSREKADKAKLAVIEVCLNAIEHGSSQDPNKRVSIELYPQEDTLVIDVADSGKGFVPPELPKEFPPKRKSSRRGF
ncbi:MAG: ATP-binding protein, partial [Gammaproteobacteria bacterium]|nr:ATP-binding protein [Gammaproteobacteria bacterium]